MITIKAKPFDNFKNLKFDPKDITKVYRGRLDDCRCGCAGDYYEPGVTPTADRFIQNALKALQQYAGYGEVTYDRFTYKDPSENELYLEFCTEVRTMCDHDEGYDGYYDGEDARIGYGFYIKDGHTK